MEKKDKRKNQKIYQQIPLFADLSPRNLDQLFDISEEVTIKSHDYLIHEGEIGKDFFIILEGAVEVLKYDEKRHHNHIITTLTHGATLGEMAWLNNAPRSASVRAKTSVRVLKIPIVEIQKLADKEAGFYRVFKHISINLSQHLRSTDEFAVRALERELQENRIRVALSNFMLNMIVVLCLFSFALTIMIHLTTVISSTTFISIIFLFILLGFFFIIKRSSQLPLETFGLTTHNIKQAVVESVGFTIFAMMIALLLKWIFIKWLPGYEGATLFEPYRSLAIGKSSWSPHLIWLLSLVLYCFISVPFQEFLARGGLQGPLLEFLTGRHKEIASILVSNLIFSTMHLYLSIKIALIVFFPGLYFGWLFARHRNLFGVCIAHLMLGVWGLFILGF